MIDEEVCETREEDRTQNEEKYLGNQQHVEGKGDKVDAEY
jgi:hypothetical protein